MSAVCRCGACEGCWHRWALEKPMCLRTSEELQEFVDTQYDSDVHRSHRVDALYHLYCRSGLPITDETPYLIWTVVMGDKPPPWTPTFGMFRRMPDESQHFLHVARPRKSN